MMSDYERGRYDMLVAISNIEYGKQCYFLQPNDLIFSRRSGEYMSLEDAVEEFCDAQEWSTWWRREYRTNI